MRSICAVLLVGKGGRVCALLGLCVWKGGVCGCGGSPGLAAAGCGCGCACGGCSLSEEGR